MSLPTAERKLEHKLKRKKVARKKRQRKKEWAAWTYRETSRKKQEQNKADDKARRERETQKAREKNIKKPNFLQRLFRAKPKTMGKR